MLKIPKKTRERSKLYPKRIVLPLTAAQYDRLHERWLAGHPAIVEQIRQALDRAAVQEPST
jgi:hypothetical protein